jgi:antitoxin component of MazEF toxin-antitoxin module
MKIKKQIFKSGNSFVIYLDKIIMDNLNLNIGDFVDISTISKVKVLPKEESNNEMIFKIKNRLRGIKK